MAEAATVFRDGSKEIVSPDDLTSHGAMTWVAERVGKLLKEEEQISQAIVFAIGREHLSYELLPSSWGSTPQWIATGEEAYG